MAVILPSDSVFVFVDTAVGGEDHRNHPMRHAEFCPHPKARGVYVTWLLYDDGLPRWFETHTNSQGHRTVSGYRGSCLALVVPFDIDRPLLAEALRDVRRLVDYLTYVWDIPPAALRICFSGSKGFHLEIPSALFGGFPPSVDIPYQVGQLARALLDGLDIAIDMTVYEPLRLWRVENTIHQKTGRYAIPLTVAEVQTLDVDAICRLAAEARMVACPSDDEWAARPELADVWRKSGMAETAAPRSTSEPFPERIHAGSGQRHNALVSMAGTLRRRGLGARTIGKMLLAFSEDFFDPPAPETDIVKIAESVAGYAVQDAEAVAARLIGIPSSDAYLPSTVLIETPGRPPSVCLGEVVRR